MIHNSRECHALAMAAMAAAGAADAAQAPAAEPQGASEEPEPTLDFLSGGGRVDGAAQDRRATVRTGSDQRRAQLEEQISEARCGRARRCIEGGCDAPAGQPQMVCLGSLLGSPLMGPCPARVHGVTCAQIASGFASLGVFRCSDCRLRSLMPSSVGVADFVFSDAARLATERAMLLEMSAGAEQTGASFAEFKRLEAQFALSLGVLVGDIALPSDDPEVFKLFLAWVATTSGRALSLETIWRAAGSVMSRTRGAERNLTRLADVKSFYESLRHAHGEESHPRTAATRRMVRLMLDRLVDARFAGEELRARTKLMIALEVMMGLRVGEALSGGDFHGLMANHLSILESIETGEETVEALLEHSKTRFKRVISAVGTSRGAGAIPLAQLIRDYWAVAGFHLVTLSEGGFRVTRPDYYVVRVPLMGLGVDVDSSRNRLATLGRLLERSSSREARRWAGFSLQRARARMEAKTSQDKRYINVVGGRMESPEVEVVCAELMRAGFACSLVPGPLMRSSHFRAPVLLSHMPLQPQGTYDSLHSLFDDAYAQLVAEGGDPELDLRGLPAPLWGHHSLRRMADSIARATMSESGATEQDIDITFGWLEAMYNQRMQLHYASHLDRTRRARVTSLV